MSDEQISSTRGEAYDAAYEMRAAAGENVHGEADFVMRFTPRSVLDAGCGTGRVGRELARRGVEVVGVDVDGDMLSTARAKGAGSTWLHADISQVELGRTFDVVLMAGNVVNFVIPTHRRPAVRNMARHVAPGGCLISGHSIRIDGCSASDLDAWARAEGLQAEEQWSSWDREAVTAFDDYSLVVLRRPRAG